MQVESMFARDMYYVLRVRNKLSLINDLINFSDPGLNRQLYPAAKPGSRANHRTTIMTNEASEANSANLKQSVKTRDESWLPIE